MITVSSVCGKTQHDVKYSESHRDVVCCSECQTIRESRQAWVKCGDCLRPECKGCE